MLFRSYEKRVNYKYQKDYHKKLAKKLKEIVINHYCKNKPKCFCCNETEIDLLTIDHINNDGAKHRKSLSGVYYKVYRDIIKNNFPKSFQILCHNCNWAKSSLGVCPHRRKMC